MRKYIDIGKQKKNLASIIAVLFLLGTFSSFAQSTLHCDYEINSETNFLTSLIYKPGDTLCLMAGVRGPLYLKSMVGTAENPIVIINKGGQVIIDSDLAYGLKFVECENIVLSGAGDQNTQFGIYVREATAGFGLEIGNKSTDFEVERLEIRNTKYSGIVAKTDPSCTNNVVRDNFTMYNLNIHDNYIHLTGNEGMYIGSSFFLGQYLSDCDITVLPHLIDGVEIYNNRIEYTGWDAIQVGSALNGCNIHDNYIYKDSQSETPFQMSGIIVNTGSGCNVYNNRIIDGKGTGILNQGTGGQKFFNNLSINAGRDYDFANQTSKQQYGIYSKYIYVVSDNSLHFYNNTIINPKSDGIRIVNSPSDVNRFINNIIINPGAYEYYQNLGSVDFKAGDAYIHNYLDATKIFSVNNILERSSKDQFFADTISQDYHLKRQSPAVNWGYNLSSYGGTFDIENYSRPYENYFDIGAYELQIPTPVSSLPQPDKQFKISPNPASDILYLSVHLDKDQRMGLKIVSMDGKEFEVFVNTYFTKGENSKRISIGHLPRAEYLIILYNESARITQKFQKL